MTSVKSVIHSFLNEPELVRTLDYIEAFLYLIFAFSMTTAYLLERTGNTKAGVTAVIVSIATAALLGLVFVLRRPINRDNREGVVCSFAALR